MFALLIRLELLDGDLVSGHTANSLVNAAIGATADEADYTIAVRNSDLGCVAAGAVF